VSRPALEFAKRHRLALVVLSLGFTLRLWLSPAPGYEGDLRAYQLWAKSAVKFGLARSYEKQVGGAMLPNYPPLSMMIFAATGKAYETFVSRVFSLDEVAYRTVIKLPAMLADIATAALLYRLVRREGFRIPWLAPAIYLAHPAVFYDSAVWGQTDSIYSAFVVGAS
jgi:Gpi18-like mannosyltransferase